MAKLYTSLPLQSKRVILITLLVVTSTLGTVRAESDSELNIHTFHMAAALGAATDVKTHLDAGIDINVKDDKGLTALHHAAEGASVSRELLLKTIRVLLNRGANIDAQDLVGRTPLHAAVEAKRITVIKELMNSGANRTLIDDKGRSAAARASEMGRKDIVGMLAGTPRLKLTDLLSEGVLTAAIVRHDKATLSSADLTQVRQAIHIAFDLESMSSSMLSQKWSSLSSNQRVEFLEIAERFLTSSYLSTLDRCEGARVSVGEYEIEGEWMKIALKCTGKYTYDIEFRLKESSGKWMIVDWFRDGISTVRNYRSQFVKELEKYSYEKLVDNLRKKYATAIAPMPAVTDGGSEVQSGTDGLAKTDEHKKSDSKKNQEQLSALMALAEIGDTEAQYALGIAYGIGLGINQDSNLAETWAKKAAESGHEYAKKSLSIFRKQYNKQVQTTTRCSKRKGEIAEDYVNIRNQDTYGWDGPLPYRLRMELASKLQFHGCHQAVIDILGEVFWPAYTLESEDALEALMESLKKTGRSKEAGLALIASDRERDDYLRKIPEGMSILMTGFGYRLDDFVQHRGNIRGSPWAYRSIFYEHSGREQLAEEALRQAWSVASSANDFFIIGLAHHQHMNDPVQAIRAYEAVLERLPATPENKRHSEINMVIPMLMSLYQSTNQQPKLDLKGLQDYVRRDPANDRAAGLLAGMFMAADRTADAKKVLQESIKHNPKSAQLHLDLGALYAKMGNLDDAIQEYKRAINENGSGELSLFEKANPPIAKVKAMINLGRAYSEKRDSGNAIKLYEDVLSVFGGGMKAEAHAGLALELAQQGQTKEALVHFQEAERFKPDDGEIQLNLGWAYYLLGNGKEAVDHLQKALRFFEAKNDVSNIGLVRDRLKVAQQTLHDISH